MTLLNHSCIRNPAIALLLIFCLPAQALASMLIACEKHLSNTTVSQVVTVEETLLAQQAAPDCHGTNTAAHSEPDTNDYTNPDSVADADNCVHCNGICQNLKSPGLINSTQVAQFFDISAVIRLTLNTAVGVSNTPVRPPCTVIPS